MKINVEPFVNDICCGIDIEWSGREGFGHYTLYHEKDSDKWHGDSECMDDNEDKTFLVSLLTQFIKEIEID